LAIVFSPGVFCPPGLFLACLFFDLMTDIAADSRTANGSSATFISQKFPVRVLRFVSLCDIRQTLCSHLSMLGFV
jgi:hypothetical protein